ncbi:MAG: DNA replication/repair protein RecF [Bradymonadaceae bacterium]|nr:DNA replication/repair protein RecF [Lujinxingiaceae bacterium]
MLLEALHLHHFRNLSKVRVEPHQRFNILAGDNGQGKTNFLEAIYLLSAVKSFRPSTNNASLIGFGHEQAVLEAKVERGGYERVVRVDVSERGKRVFLNENPVRNLSDFFGTVNVVTFGPEDIYILKGGPSERRRFVDRAIFNAHPAYATEAMNFEEILKHRNALLKGDGYDANLFAVYDEQFIDYAASMLQRRLDFIHHFRPVLERTFRAIFDPDFETEIAYEMKWPSTSPGHDGSLDELREDRVGVERLLQRGLEQSMREERQRGFTVIGPHRDDLSTTLNGRDVKTFASQGQHRAFVLAMKIAEITYLEERYHFAPILLLDDVSSELDRERNRHLFDFLRGREQGQVFITTTHRDYILLEDDVSVYRVQAGEVCPC